MDEKKTPPPGYNEIPNQDAPPQYTQQYPAAGYPQQPQYQVQYAPGPQQYAPGPQQYPQGPVYYNQSGQPITNQPTTVIINPGPLQSPPSDHMAYSIFVTLCCCWPIGIFAIMKSMESRDASNRGNREMADTKSREAKKFGNWALGIGIGMLVMSFVIIGIYIGFTVTQLLKQHEYN